jgi:hypothetical protein
MTNQHFPGTLFIVKSSAPIKAEPGCNVVDYLTQRRIIKESWRWNTVFIATYRQQEENAS